MASLEQDTVSGRYRIRFRFGGRAYKRSLKTCDRREAKGVVGRVEEMIRLLERGRFDLPQDADPGSFILSDGKVNGKLAAHENRTVQEPLRLYLQSLPDGAKEHTTLRTEQTHVSHLLRYLPGSRLAQTVTTADMQMYVDKRVKVRYRGKRIRPETVRKEVATFRVIWNWALARGIVCGPSPSRDLQYPKSEQKPPFMTWDDIERIERRGGLTAEEKKGLWECLFLHADEIQDMLDDVRQRARHAFVFPMFVFAAHTGARRSEILRSQVDDVDFAGRSMLIREKKRSRDKSLTYRRVQMSDLLVKALKEWFSDHPGGPWTICAPLVVSRGKARPVGVPLTPSEAHDHFKRTLSDSKWSRIRGFHVLRHSFASNLAAAGVDQRIIDEWMGHQTDEMRKRYRHLFPDQQQKVIDSVFGGNGK